MPEREGLSLHLGQEEEAGRPAVTVRDSWLFGEVECIALKGELRQLCRDPTHSCPASEGKAIEGVFPVSAPGQIDQKVTK